MIHAIEKVDETPARIPVAVWDIDRYKKRAKRLKKYLATLGIDIVHGHALEAVARIHGLSSYHELSTMIKRGKCPLEFLDDHLRFTKRVERLRSYLSTAGKEISQDQAKEFIALAYRKQQSNQHAESAETIHSGRETTPRGPALRSSSSVILVWNAQANGEK